MSLMARVVVTSYEHVRYVNNEHSVLRRAEARYERFFERGRTVSAEAYSSGSTLRSFLATPLFQCRSERLPQLAFPTLFIGVHI